MAKLTQEAVARAILATHGNVSAAANRLGVARASVQERVAKSPEMQQTVIDARETIVDTAEAQLGKAVKKGQAWAITFTLKTQGKSRGYVERTETENIIRDRLVIEEEVADPGEEASEGKAPPGAV